METEQKDYQWSKGNRTKRLSMIKRKQNKKTIDSLCSVSFWSLIVFLFCFLLIIDSLFVLFPFDHWYSLCSVSIWLLIVFVFCSKRLSMIKRKQHKKNINDQRETEQKEYQWSQANRTQRLSMIKGKQNKQIVTDQRETIIDILCVLFPFDHW
jgi:hypothetical protein